MKTETKELMRLFGIAILVLVALPIVYRGYVYFWPPEEKPRQTLTQFLEEAQRERCMGLLTKPVGKWSDAEAKLEPEIYSWLKEQGNEILPWEWTEEARRKDPKGHSKQKKQKKGISVRAEILPVDGAKHPDLLYVSAVRL